jgi:hypothetical protein
MSTSVSQHRFVALPTITMITIKSNHMDTIQTLEIIGAVVAFIWWFMIVTDTET